MSEGRSTGGGWGTSPYAIFRCRLRVPHPQQFAQLGPPTPSQLIHFVDHDIPQIAQLLVRAASSVQAVVACAHVELVVHIVGNSSLFPDPTRISYA